MTTRALGFTAAALALAHSVESIPGLVPIVPAPAEGSKRARDRKSEQAIRAREVYANTPAQPITRQQRRAAERASRT